MCFIYFIQKQVEAFIVHLRLRFFFFWRQIYKLYQSSDYIAESKFLLFMELAFIEKLKFLSSFFSIQIPVKKLIFPPKNLEKYGRPKYACAVFFLFLGDVNKINLFVFSFFLRHFYCWIEVNKHCNVQFLFLYFHSWNKITCIFQ